MTKNLLEKIEKSGKPVNLSYSEIRKLLWQDPESKAYPQLYSFFLDNKDLGVFPSGVSEADVMTALRVELKAKQQEFDDVIYFKELEDSLSTQVEIRIGETSAEFRREISQLIGEMSVLDDRKIAQIRDAATVDILDGELGLDKKTIEDYIKLVRAEVGLQLAKIDELEFLLSDGTIEQKTRDVYEKIGYLFKFFASNIDDDTGSKKAYLKAFLMRKMRSEKGFAMIKTWYADLQSNLKGDDIGDCRQSIKAMVERMHLEANTNRPQHLREILKQYAPEVQIAEQDLQNIFRKDAAGNDMVNVLGDASYVQKIGCHLEEIEATAFHIGLEETMTDIDPSVLSERRSFMAKEIRALKNDLHEYQGQVHTVEELIETKFKALPFSKRYRLKKANDALSYLRKSGQESRAEIEKLDSESHVDRFLDRVDANVEAYLLEQGSNREDLKRLKLQDPNFDIYDYLKQSEDDKAALLEDKKGDSSPYLNGDVLNQVRVQLERLQAICNRNFSQPNDLEAFDRAKLDIEELRKDQVYLVEEVVNDEQGRAVFEDDVLKVQQVKESKKLPYVEESRLRSMLLQRDHKRVFEMSQQKLAELGDLETDHGKIRTALSTLYSEMYECGNETQINKLTKMMTVDHPLTCIRFNAAKKQPFMSSDGKYYQMLDIKGRATIVGQIATYKERSQELLKEAKRLMRDGNFAQLRQLFNPGEKGDRLYMDSAFFPVNLLKGNNAQCTALLYETGVDDQGKVIPTRPSEKIPLSQHSRFNLKDESSRKRDEEICHDPDLKALPDCLADDPEFISAMKLDKETQATINQYQEALVLDEKTGETYVDEKKVREMLRAGKKVMGAGAESEIDEETLKLTKTRLEEIAKTNPLAAARAAQYNSEILGMGSAAVQHAGRKMVDLVKVLPKVAGRYAEDYWKGLTFYSPMSLYFAVEQAAEHIPGLADFNVKFKSYMLMSNMFKGTIIGSEFEKLMQGKENERVDDFKKAYDQYGNETILEKLLTSRDRFEFKQVLIQGFQERGLFTNEDLCTTAFLKTLNKFNPNYTIAIKWGDEEMATNQDVQTAVLEEIKKSIDKFWGGGQYQSWKNASASKYESWRKQSFDNFAQYRGPLREKIYTDYWTWLSDPEGLKKLKAMHPGELVGNIENDMVVGHLNSGQSFAIFQALLCEGILKYEHLARLELTDHHINNLPFMTFMEPNEAEFAGLSQVYRDCKHLPYTADANPFVGFYEGKTALKLKAHRVEGKWGFAKSKKDNDHHDQAGTNQMVVMTAHQLQRRREAQPEWFKKMDNSCIGLFLPSYNWGQIEAGLTMDNLGEITGARPHDLCAGYRGMQWEFTSYLESMSDKKGHPELNDVGKFKQQIYFAYEALSKNGALAGYFSRQKGRKNDYAFNSDGSPKFDSPVKEQRAQSGKTNFEKQILDISGHNQRLNESAATLDAMKAFDEDSVDGTITYEMRKAFKKMTGHPHLKSIGMDTVTGKKNPAHYTNIDIQTFDPSGIYRDEAIPAFIENVLLLAQKRGIRDEIEESLGIKTYGPGGVFGNFKAGDNRRDYAINQWRINEAMMK